MASASSTPSIVVTDKMGNELGGSTSPDIPGRRSSRGTFAHAIKRSHSNSSSSSGTVSIGSSMNSFVSAKQRFGSGTATPVPMLSKSASDGKNVGAGVNGEEGGVDDEMMYLRRTHTFTTLVPMSVETQIVSYDDLPEEAKAQPTKLFSWARMTQENLYIDTIVPPSCKVCLEALEARVAKQSQPFDLSLLAGAAPAIQLSRPYEVSAPKMHINHGIAL
ncbi:hypothetical protein CBS101457_000859 [Exobasidium rhododendri]|nr:hypothetical protein CBS101457_000859 [Exobasidium rhododendri]